MFNVHSVLLICYQLRNHDNPGRSISVFTKCKVQDQMGVTHTHMLTSH